MSCQESVVVGPCFLDSVSDSSIFAGLAFRGGGVQALARGSGVLAGALVTAGRRVVAPRAAAFFRGRSRLTATLLRVRGRCGADQGKR